MTPDKEKTMRTQLADYSKGEFVDLAISMQELIDGHIKKNEGLQSSIDAMKGQIPILKAELDKYEGGTPADSEEVAALQEEVGTLQVRVNTLSDLNEKLQAKLLA